MSLTKQEGLLSLIAQRAACETWNVHPFYWPKFSGNRVEMLILFDR